MHPPTDRCLFCLSDKGPFTREEHPIPESLGNDDLVLPRGTVCDGCNQHFGSKLEKPVLSLGPFAFERFALNVRNKKGRVPPLNGAPHYTLYPTGYRDVAFLTGTEAVLSAAMAGQLVPLPWTADADWLVARFLVKMGLELMVLREEINPYESQFDPARRFARGLDVGETWQYAVGRYPRRDDLFNFQTERAGEMWTNEQLYRWSVGMMQTGELGFSFLYRDHYFMTNLNTPECEGYVQQFNLMNEFHLRVVSAKPPHR